MEGEIDLDLERKGADLGEEGMQGGEGRGRKTKICGWRRPWWSRVGVGTKFQRVKFQPWNTDL